MKIPSLARAAVARIACIYAPGQEVVGMRRIAVLVCFAVFIPRIHLSTANTL